MRDDVVIIPAGNPSEWTGPGGNNTYLLPGEVPTLIDAGVGHRLHIEAVAAALAGAPLVAVLITHGHRDHTAGIPAIRQRWPDVIVRNAMLDTCTDGEMIAAGETTLRAIHTPGHSPDHFCFLDLTNRDLYCGDLVRIGGTVVIPASTGGSLTEYIASLHRVRGLAPRRLLPGHGPAIADPESLIEQYLSHRAERERQVEDALVTGDVTIDAIVARVYRDLPVALVAAARETVLAHLLKLAAEGRAVEHRGEWKIGKPG